LWWWLIEHGLSRNKWTAYKAFVEKYRQKSYRLGKYKPNFGHCIGDTFISFPVSTFKPVCSPRFSDEVREHGCSYVL
jgi:hypothetical protein